MIKYLFKYFLLILSFLFFISCKKHQVKIITNSVSSITSTNAICGGEITDDGGETILSYGVCWGTSTGPVLGTNNYTVDGSGKASFTSKINSLKHKTTYYIRAYAKHSAGITYGNEQVFYTPALVSSTIPIIYTYEYSNVDTLNRTLNLNAELMHPGGSSISEKGFVWNLKGGPSLSDNKIVNSSNTDIFSNQFSFDFSTQYYIKSYAVNTFGVSYGSEIVIKIEKSKPKVHTNEILEIDSNYAICSSEVTYAGGGQIIERGVCWASFSNPTINDNKTSDGIGMGEYVSKMTNLLPNTLYYFRSYATNSEGTTYGKEISFRTMVGKLYIGMSYKGGIIFYIEPMNGGGLLVSNDDLGNGTNWACQSNVIGAVNKNLGAGKDNSEAILATCGNSGAAGLCSDYKYGIYDDWFLPSYGDLELIYKNLKETDKEKFSIGYYWSSTQKDANNALRYGFLGGNYGEASKSSTQFVRAVRKF
jgi:hypothetical protein